MYDHANLHSRRHLNRFIRFCRAHSNVKQTQAVRRFFYFIVINIATSQEHCYLAPYMLQRRLTSKAHEKKENSIQKVKVLARLGLQRIVTLDSYCARGLYKYSYLLTYLHDAR